MKNNTHNILFLKEKANTIKHRIFMLKIQLAQGGQVCNQTSKYLLSEHEWLNCKFGLMI